MPTVCFTGAGKRFGTDTFTRVDWEALAATNRWSVRDKVGTWPAAVDVLVASRTDTTKAEAARRQRVEVITYAEFERRLYTYTPRRDPGSDMDEVMRVAGERASGVPRGRCPVHMCTLDANGTCLDCARLERRRGMAPGQHASRVRAEMEAFPITTVSRMPRRGEPVPPHYAVNGRTFTSYDAAGVYRAELLAEQRRPRCTPHGFILEECNACAANAAAAQERERLAQIEQERIEAARLPPVGVLTGRRKLNLGDD